MATSACSHRWVSSVIVQHGPDEFDIEFVAHEGCRGLKEYLDKRIEDPDVLSAEAMGTRVQHFIDWLAKDEIAKFEANHPESSDDA